MVDALEGALGEARASDEASHRFLADVAHQIRTPIAGIRASVAALMRTTRRQLSTSVTYTLNAPDGDSAQLLGNPDALEEAIRNLLDNAARHAERAVRVDVALADSDAELQRPVMVVGDASGDRLSVTCTT